MRLAAATADAGKPVPEPSWGAVMSIVHQAYLFDYRRFETELADTLYAALERDDVRALRAFIQRHLHELTDFETEEPPSKDWEERMEEELQNSGASKVQWFADLALTKYYDFTDSLGLDYSWDALHAYLGTVPALRPHADRVVATRARTWDPENKRTLGFAHLGGATLDNEENYLIKKFFSAAGAVSIENQARI